MASEATGTGSLAGRYAAALFDLADERHELDAVAGDLRELRTMLHESVDLGRLLRSPVLSREEQAKAIAVLTERAGLSKLTRDFLAVVAANRRLFAVPAMIEATSTNWPNGAARSPPKSRRRSRSARRNRTHWVSNCAAPSDGGSRSPSKSTPAYWAA